MPCLKRAPLYVSEAVFVVQVIRWMAEVATPF